METPGHRPRRTSCHAAPPELEKKRVRTAGTIDMPPLTGLGLGLDVCAYGRGSTIRVSCGGDRTRSKRSGFGVPALAGWAFP